jgi:hypothetical protein
MNNDRSKFIVIYLAVLGCIALVFMAAFYFSILLPQASENAEVLNRFFQIAAINRGSIVYIAFPVASIILFTKRLSFGWTFSMAILLCSTLFYCSGLFIQLKSSADKWILINISIMAGSFYCMLLLMQRGLRKQFEVTNKNYLLSILIGFVLVILQYYGFF